MRLRVLAAALMFAAAVVPAVTPTVAAAPTIPASPPTAPSPQDAPTRRPSAPPAAGAPRAGAPRPAGSAPRAYTARAAERLDTLAEHTGGAHGIVVADVRTGRELYARHGGIGRTLASNTKLFITAAALDRWGTRIGAALRRILRLSDNLRAEALAVRLGDGSRARGLRRAERFAARIGARVRLRDGSGLATGNTATPRQVVRFLVAMRRVRGHRVWESALPVAGRSGTLAHRLRGTAAESRCRAKTGTLFLRTYASTLSGYCRTRSGRSVAFSMLMATTPTNGRVVQDRLLARIAAR
jgi:D-alanyl-D-alanine carboxypeptidase